MRLILFDWQTLLGFEVAYKLITTSIFVPLVRNSLNLVVHLNGYGYLTAENAGAFLRSPLTIFYLLILLLVLLFYSLIDAAAVIYILDRSRQKKESSALSALKFGLKKAVHAFRPKNLLLIVVVLLLVPLTSIGLVSGYVLTVQIPDFVNEFIQNRWPLVLAISIVVLALEIAIMRWLYTFHYYCLEDADFREARKKSLQTGTGVVSRLRDFLWLLVIQLLLLLVYILFAIVGIVIIYLIYQAAGGVTAGYARYNTLVYRYLNVILQLIQAMSVPFGYAMISALFYRYNAVDRMETAAVLDKTGGTDHETDRGTSRGTAGTKEKKLRNGRSLRRVQAETLLLVLSLVLYSWYSWRSTRSAYNIYAESVHELEVTAHRGASKQYPENTMAAFIGAVEQGADWIELDVQQSSDGQIFVMHDSSFKRTTGVSAYAWELTWDEISELDAGSWFSEDFAGEKIPLLSDVLLFAKLTGIRLNIELKPTGHETDFEAEVVQLIHDYGFENDCVITSQDYDSLEKVKEADENIRTVYVMSIAFGDLTQLSCADDFSIEATFATKTLVRRLHAAGCRVYVWTVNTRRTIRGALNNGADNIITDNVPLANQLIDERQTGSAMRILIDQISDLMSS